MQRIWILALAVVTLGLGGCILDGKPAEVPSAAIIQYPLRELELQNGMRVLLEQAPDFDLAGAVLVVDGGSADESPDKAGLGHLTEHLAFDAKHGGASLTARQYDLGTAANAATGWEQTTFYAFDTSSSLADLVSLLLGVVKEPLAGVDVQQFQHERQVVEEEVDLRADTGTPGQALGWLMTEVFSAGHAYAHPIGGTQASLAGLTFDDVRAFATTNYRPEASTLVLSAPLALDAQQALVERVTGERARVRPPGANLRPKNRPAALDTPARSLRTFEAEVPTPTLWIGWSVPSAYGDQGHLPLLLKSTVLMTLEGGVARRDADIAEVDADVVPGTAASLFFVRVALKQAAHPESTAQAIVDELEGSLGKLSSWGLTSAETRRVVAAKYKYDEEDMTARAVNLAHSYHRLGLPTFLRSRGDRIIGSSADEAVAFAHTFLADKRAHIVLVRPARPPLPSPSLQQASSPSGVPSTLAPASVPPAESAHRSEYSPLLGALESHDLPNGLKLILLPRPGSPFHTVLLGFKGGRVHAVPPGVATAMNWARETDQRSPDLWGIDHRYYVWTGGTVDVLRSTGKDVQLTLHHLHRMLGFSVFWPPRRFTERLGLMKQQDMVPAAILNRRLGNALFGSHPAGNVATAEDMSKITPAQVLRWVDRVRHPHNGVVIIVGDFDPKQALAAATDELGTWAYGSSPRPAVDSPPPLDEIPSGQPGQVLLQDRPGAQEARVQLRCLLPPATTDNLAASRLFAQNLQRKALRELREKAAATYAVGAHAVVLPGGTTVFELTADIAYPRLSESLRRLRAVLAAPGAGPVAANGKPARGPSWYLGVDSTHAMADYFFDMWSGGWPLDTLDRLPAQMQAVSAHAVAEVAQHCRENWVIGLLGDEPRLREAWFAY